MQTIKFENKKETKKFFEWLSKKLKKHRNDVFNFSEQQWNFDTNPVIAEDLIVVTLVSPNNVMYISVNRDNHIINVQLSLEDQISGFGYNSMQKNLILSNIVYRVLTDYTEFKFCEEK